MFTVLMPSYNPGPYLPHAIESVLSQFDATDELIVQDGGSTDGSREYLDELEQSDARVRVFHESDNGQADAMNRGLARAVNPWTIWLNADDLVLSGAMRRLRTEVSRDQCSVVGGAYSLVNSMGEIAGTIPARPLRMPEILRVGCAPIFSGSLAIKTDLLRSLGGFDQSLHYCMDFDIQLKIARSGAAIRILDQPIGAFRVHDRSKTMSKPAHFVKEGSSLMWRYSSSPSQKVAAILGMLLVTVGACTPIRYTKGYLQVRGRVVNATRHVLSRTRTVKTRGSTAIGRESQ